MGAVLNVVFADLPLSVLTEDFPGRYGHLFLFDVLYCFSAEAVGLKRQIQKMMSNI